MAQHQCMGTAALRSMYFEHSRSSSLTLALFRHLSASPSIHEAQHLYLCEIISRCIVLIILLEKGIVKCPYDWLVAQIDGYAHFIRRIFTIVKNFAQYSRPDANVLLDAISTLTGLPPPCMLRSTAPQSALTHTLAHLSQQIHTHHVCQGLVLDEAQFLTDQQFGEYPRGGWSSTLSPVKSVIIATHFCFSTFSFFFFGGTAAVEASRCCCKLHMWIKYNSILCWFQSKNARCDRSQSNSISCQVSGLCLLFLLSLAIC